MMLIDVVVLMFESDTTVMDIEFCPDNNNSGHWSPNNSPEIQMEMEKANFLLI